MRLHNRLIRPGFWTDTDLILALPMAGRMYYMGLVQLSEDSGCVEDNMMAHKIHLFPGDMDVTPEAIQEWRDVLVGLGKLIPYEANGKRCLFLKNFHKHQSLRKPAAPDLPLPPWVTWNEPYTEVVNGKEVNRNGFYSVQDSYEVDMNPVSTSHSREPEPEPELEPEPERESSASARKVAVSAEPDNPTDSLSSPDLSIVTKHYHEQIGMMGPTQFEKLRFWVDEQGMPPEIVCAAIDVTTEQADKPGIAYVEAVLRNWHNEGVTTLDDVKKREQARSRDAPSTTEGAPNAASFAAVDQDAVRLFREMYSDEYDDAPVERVS